MVQLLSCVRLFATPWTATCQLPCPSPNSQSLFTVMSIEFVMPSNHLMLYHPLLFLPSIFPNISVFSNESVLSHQVAKVLELQLQHLSSNEYSVLISFGIVGLIFLQSKGLRSLLQHHSSKAPILWHSTFFMVQLSHLFMMTRKTIALTI